MEAMVIAVAAFAVGSIPFSNIAARLVAGVDLRTVSSGTVSGTSLYRVAGFVPLAIAGVADVAKGSLGPLLAGPERPVLVAVSGGLAVVGHNWSPWLRGAGGRGISPALGVLLVAAWPGAVLLLAGMVAGKVFSETALGAFVAELALVPVAALTYGSAGALAAVAVLVPMLAKRMAGNRPPDVRRPSAYLHRLVFDCDPHERRAP